MKRLLPRAAALALFFLVLGAVGVIGQPTTNPLPTPGVDPGPAWASTLNAAISELQQIVAQKLGNASLNITDGDVLHGMKVIHVHAAAAVPTGTSAFTGGTSMYWQGAAAGDTAAFSLPPAFNDRVRSVFVYGRANGTTAWTCKLYSQNMLTGVVTQLGSTLTSGTAAAIQALNFGALTQTLAADTVLLVEWTAGASGNRVYGVEVQFDKISGP